jgi:hypothetical protein
MLTVMRSALEAGEDAIMVCLNGMMTDRMRQIAPDIDKNRFITVGQIKNGMLNGRHPKLFLEDLDQHLHYITGHHNVAAVSITED